MAWLAVDKNGDEYVYSCKPIRETSSYWGKDCDKHGEDIGEAVKLPRGSIKKLIGRELTWEDEPVELKD